MEAQQNKESTENARESSRKHNENKKNRRDNARRLTIQNEQANGIYTIKEDKRTYKQKLEERKNARKI